MSYAGLEKIMGKIQHAATIHASLRVRTRSTYDAMGLALGTRLREARSVEEARSLVAKDLIDISTDMAADWKEIIDILTQQSRNVIVSGFAWAPWEWLHNYAF